MPVDLAKMTAKDRARFQASLRRSNVRGACWAWGGSHKPKGYGRFFFQGHNVAAHRVAQHVFCREIPEGYEIDHTCRTRDCVNPAHLEAVQPAENRKRRIEHYKKG